MHRDWKFVGFILFWLFVGALVGIELAATFGEQQELILTSP
jgi:hypothetical protein